MPNNKNEMAILNNRWIDMSNNDMNSDDFMNSQEFWKVAAYKFFDLSDDTDLDRYGYVLYIMRYTGQLEKELDKLRVNVYNKGKINVPRLIIKNSQISMKY
jgi:hypothetical protein